MLQYSHKKTCFEVSYQTKIQTFSPKTLLKRGSNKVAFLWILQNFEEQLFWRTSANDCLNVFLREQLT